MTTLTMTEMYDFERAWWVHAGSKDDAIRARFDVSPDAYHRALEQVAFTEVALEHDPTLTKRIRRLAAQRRRQKAHR